MSKIDTDVRALIISVSTIVCGLLFHIYYSLYQMLNHTTSAPLNLISVVMTILMVVAVVLVIWYGLIKPYRQNRSG